MNRIGIFYGSSTGTTAEIANRIGKHLNVPQADIFNVHESAPDLFGNYDILVLGTSTWGDGEIQEDWYDMLAGASSLCLKDKRIALFGCGDENMTETFCNGVGQLYNELLSTEAKFIAPYPADCYAFNSSTAIRDGVAVGLLLDEANHPELTEKRIADWSEMIKNS